MAILEKHIELYVVKWAKTNGMRVRKLNGLGAQSWPDRLFCIPGGRPVFIEFKKPGGVPTPLQWDMINGLKRDGYEVYVIDNREAGIAVLREAMEAGKVPSKGNEVPTGARRQRAIARSWLKKN